MTLLHCAVEGDHTEIVEILVKNGAKVDAKANTEECKGYTPLYCAGERGHTKIAKILIANRTNVNAKADAGEAKGITPLHCAAKKGHTEIVRILIANGADPLLKHKDSKTPEKQLKQQALNKSISAGGATALLGTAAAVALFVTGTVAVGLIPIVIAVVAVTAAVLVVGGITYGVLKPSTKMDEVEKQKVTKEEVQEVV
ncbi:MAG: ankyrin repeat domain-containing protein [Rickettsiales bacterium]|nr:ankyrin repeat domain-containing protein [Rickettsiales bacterium]